MLNETVALPHLFEEHGRESRDFRLLPVRLRQEDLLRTSTAVAKWPAARSRRNGSGGHPVVHQEGMDTSG